MLSIYIGEHLSDEFGSKINRFNKLPVIHEEDGFKLAETVAIYHYLGRKKVIPERWYPSDKKKLAKIDEYLQWNHNSLIFSAGSIFYNAWIRPLRGDAGIIEHAMMKNVNDPLNYVDIENSLDELEHTWLKDSDFLCGNEPTFAELIASCVLMQVIGLQLYKLNEEKYPKVNGWLNQTRIYFNPEFDIAHQYVYKYGERLKGKSPFE